ncbi:MAG: hypothetical protein ACT4OK_05080 [Gemmobacter sp.]
MTDRFILCMKWGRAFGPDYVNVLHSACRRAMAAPFRFVCLTDDGAGFDPAIEVLPIPDLGLSPTDWFRPGVWPKIALFDRHFHGLRGRALFVDLDMVILRGLEGFFDVPGRIVGTDAGPGWGKTGVTAQPEFGSMIFAYDLGGLPEIAETFRESPAAAWTKLRQEQQYVHHMAPDAGFWPADWVISFKRALRRPIGLDVVLPPKAPPATARVVAFHGRPRPSDLMQPAKLFGGRRFWDRFPHMGNGPVPWMVDYWQSNGGRLPS